MSKYLRRRLAWCNQLGQRFDESKERYSLQSIADIDGTPHKGSKCKWTKKLLASYVITSPFLSILERVPEVIIIDAMFMVNVNPIASI